MSIEKGTGEVSVFRTGIQRRFNAYHALRGDFGEESHPHTHSYRVEWVIATRDLDDNGFATDISQMEHELDRLIAELEGTFLNDLSFFHERQTSIENMAAYLHSLLSELVDGDRIEWMQVTIWESETAFAAYRA